MNRIGKHIKGRVTEWPTHYVDGSFWARGGNPGPTVQLINETDFVILRVGQGTITQAQRDELFPPKKSSGGSGSKKLGGEA